MPLVEDNLFGHVDKVQIAIDRLKAFEPKEGYYLAFSGGKDSQCIYHLAKMAGVKFDAHYSVTTVDPPELMRFIRDQYPDVEWEYHYWPDDPKYNHKSGKRRQITMWNLIANHTIPPTRQARYCCSQLKETGGAGRLVVTGVRWAESVRRKQLHGIADIQTTSKKLQREALESDPLTSKLNKNGGIIFMDDNDTARRMVEVCYMKKKTTLNPIVDWLEEDVWEFLNDVAKVPHCCLYDQGFSRLGCIGCPLQGRDGMLRDFERWPRYKQLYIKAFDQMIKNHPGEIKVASGEMVENVSGGVQRFFSGGSHGTVDERRPSDHESGVSETGQSRPGDEPMDTESGRNGSDGNVAELLNNSSGGGVQQTRPSSTVVAHSDSGGEFPILDQQLLKPLSTAEKCFEWWLWMLRNGSRDEPNPIHKEWNYE